MKRRNERSRGYSLSELLTVVAIVGLITLVAVPAFMQILPQYRMRSAASELASNLRMLRARSIGTRSNWRLVVDSTNESYVMRRADNTPVNDNGLPVPSGQDPVRRLAAVNVTTGGTVTFTRDGSTATGSASSIVLETNNRFVRYNRYTIDIATSGAVTITPSKV